MKLSGFAKFAWSVLAYNVLVILWGAYVRASGSGAGCGDHWPRCNGEIIPRIKTVEMLIEFSHRASSGLLALSVLALVIWAFRSFPKNHLVRTGAVVSILFVIIEALLGAGLVKFGLVNKNDSVARAVVMSLHLINTLTLTAALALTAWWASGGRPVRIGAQKAQAMALGIALMTTVMLAVTGAVVALGDTLFPAKTLAEGMQQDFSPTAHFLIRLRIIHPILALIVATYVIVLVITTALGKTDKTTVKLARMVAAHFAVQLIIGLANLFLLAPTWMQLLHLGVANLVWISLVLFVASALANESTVIDYRPVASGASGSSTESPVLN